ncbi:hypothetical protein [Methanohalophilus portucalensis]|uniref:DUF2206 domain-containing protein n=3 Tax=Methanohalophilus portucalensis TaxID=39664 RepID=A0A1X7P1C6_9EURY|nr:hypothetical protein [Methanohalophilus portucalensis]ATU08092.1 hypothetical protein BKM01_04455 [Methanohalophilus portucalensis]RNI10068.1 hypothetical protein EFE41_08415 [Methanohalophilus portucalensis FDF-1]SMH44434.1 hypothetical protein SAMN06264941_2065 [Methanohalophilus portucalensis FDF-1]
MKNKLFDKFSTNFSLILIVLVLLGLIFGYILNNVSILLKGLVLIIPMVAVAIILPYIYKHEINLGTTISMFYFKKITLNKTFVIFYCLSILCLLVNFARPWYYFMILIILYGVIYIQLFSNNFNKNLVLLELFVVFLNFTYGVTFIYPLFFGTTDILPHINMSRMIFLQGHTLTGNIGYEYFPLYHILIASSSQLFNINIQSSLFLVTGTFSAITILFLYYISEKIVHNTQLSAFICLLYSSSSVVLFSGPNSVTRNLAFFGFIIFLYFIYTNYSKNDITLKSLSIGIIIFMVLSHQVSLPQISIVLLLLFICEHIVNTKKHLAGNLYLLYNILFLSYWFYVAYMFASRTIGQRLDLDILLRPLLISSASGSVGTEQTMSLSFYIFSNLDIIIFLFMSLIGIGYIIRKKPNTYLNVVALFSILALVLYVKNPIHLLWQFLDLFQFDRLKLIVAPFMAIIMGLGFYVFSKYLLNNKRIPAQKILLVSLLILFVGPSLIYSVPDGNAFQDGNRLYFNSQEIESYEHTSIYLSEKTIYTDYETNRFLTSNNIRNTDIIRDVNNFGNTGGYAIIRVGKFLEYGLPFRSHHTPKVASSNYRYLPNENNTLNLFERLDMQSKIYTTSSVSIYDMK